MYLLAQLLYNDKKEIIVKTYKNPSLPKKLNNVTLYILLYNCIL